MSLEALGYSNDYEQYREQHHLLGLGIGRVIAEHKERYIVKTAEQELEAEVIGSLRFTATDRSEFPAVGDWVAINPFDDDKAMIHAILPRKNSLERRAAGKEGEKQIIAANIDVALVVVAVDRDFNVNRIERYLALCYDAGIDPILLLNKADLIAAEDLQERKEWINQRIRNLVIIAVSNVTKTGYDLLHRHIIKGKTYCLLGSSGVGKSTLVNNLLGVSAMKTSQISQSTNKGRHTTSHRELFFMENGGILIDNPGMKEVGLSDVSDGLDRVFDAINERAMFCKYQDCSHTGEHGCAVIEAVESGEIELASYENYLKMLREKSHFESTIAEKKQKEKNLGKILKDYKKFRKNND